MIEADEKFYDECERLLDQRASAPPYQHWVLNQYGDDCEGSFCPDCVKLELARVVAEQGAVDPDEDETRIIHEYPESETDGSRHCYTCGALLAYTLTDYGAAQELEYFKDSPLDWNDADDCYCLARASWGVDTDEQKHALLQIFRAAVNAPPSPADTPTAAGGGSEDE